MDYSDVRVKDLDAEIQNSKAMNFYYVGKIDSAIVYLKKNIEIIDQIGNKNLRPLQKLILEVFIAQLVISPHPQGII